MVASDSALLAAAKRMRKDNKSDYTSTYFMAELNDVIGSSEDKVDVEKVTKFLDDVESMMASKKKQEV
jgi:IS4 transposase